MLTTSLFLLFLTIKTAFTASIDEIDENLELFRTDSDDSFRQFDNEKVLSEHTVDIPVSLDNAEEEDIEFENLTSLSVESLSLLSLTQFPNSVPDSVKSCVSELLQIKRSSSQKSLGFSSDDESTINWNDPNSKTITKISSFSIPAAISEAPTETVSTTAGSSTYSTMPNHLKQVFETAALSDGILSFLNTRDLCNLSLCNGTLNRILNNHATDSFNQIFPSLNGISESVFSLRILQGILQDENMKFNDCSTCTFQNPSNPIDNLESFISFRLESAKSLNERYALVHLIEFLRLSGWYERFITLPSPLKVFFADESSVFLEDFKKRIIPVVMKAAYYGHLRILRALVSDIKMFLPTSWPQIILDLFLLGTETRNGIAWTALQRSVHAPEIRVSNYLLNVLASNEAVLYAFKKNLATQNHPLASELPSFLEKLVFPCTAQQKVKKLLQKRMLLAIAVKKIRAIHLAVMKSSNPDVLRLFLVLERELIENPINKREILVLLQLAFKHKSLHSLKCIINDLKSKDIPIEFAISSDWPRGLMEYNDNLHEFITRYYGIFHIIAKYGAVEVLKFLKTDIVSSIEFLNLSEQVDGESKTPIDIALENEHWDTLVVLAKANPRQVNKKLLVKILEVNAPILDKLIKDDYELECFACNYFSKTNLVTLFEWSILSGNQQAFQWFLKKLSKTFLRRFDGAGNTPIHLAIIVGNSEALNRLLEVDPKLLTVQNYFGETPIRLAYRIRDNTSTCSKIFLIDDIVQILAEKDDKIKG